ncbi:Hypp9223 [Branchiostoma lanceolatum]|uniref:Hypp9223 protein n=1 Tax=Branchiostoma lanceolatum TaxID=7740 RepID=A0A8J9ZCQ0_BRALA|nr:Hypp9223 [Branchiostoma lanceolatum]
MGTNSGGFDIPEIQVHPPSPKLPSSACPDSDQVGCDAACCPGKNGSRKDSGLLSVPNIADHFLYTSMGRGPKCSGKCRIAEADKLAPNKTLYMRGSPEIRRAHPRPRREDTPYVDPLDALQSNPSHDLAEEHRYTEPYNSRKNFAYQWRNRKDDHETEGSSRYKNVGSEDGLKSPSTLPVRTHQCVCRCGMDIAAAQEGLPVTTQADQGTKDGSDANSTNCRETDPENHAYHHAKPTDPSVCEPYMVTNMTAITQEWQPSWNDSKSSAGSHGNGSEENNQYEVIPDHGGAEMVLEDRINMAAVEEDVVQSKNNGHFFFLFLFLLLFVAGIVCLILRFSTSTFQNAQHSTANMPGGLQLQP